MTTNEPPQNAVMEPCPIMAAFKRIASKSRNGVGEANFERYKENEQDVITVQHFLLNVETPLSAAEVSRSQERTSVTEIDVESLKKVPYTRDEMAADYFDPLEDRFSDGWNACLDHLVSKYPERFK
jgi:hypothetical protein